MLEEDGARCPSCATSYFSLYKAPIELKNLSYSKASWGQRAIQISCWATKVLLIHIEWVFWDSLFNGSLYIVSALRLPSFITIIHSYKGRTWITSTLGPLAFSLSSTASDSSLAIMKMMEEELKVTFFFGLSPSFCDITMGLICISLPTVGRSLGGCWHLSGWKHRSCKRDLRNFLIMKM